MFKTIDVIVVDPDFDRRVNLKSATLSVTDYGKVTFTSSFKSALEMLTIDIPMVIVMISSSLPEADVVKFIQEAKGTSSGVDSAYILIMRPEDQNSTTISSAVVNGVDGFLLEPFSVKGLVDVSHLAKEVYKQRKTVRQEAAIELLVRDTLQQIDDIATEMLNGKGPGPAIRTLRDLGGSIKELPEETHEFWYPTLMKFCDQAKPRDVKATSQREIKAAERLKARMESMGQNTKFLD